MNQNIRISKFEIQKDLEFNFDATFIFLRSPIIYHLFNAVSYFCLKTPEAVIINYSGLSLSRTRKGPTNLFEIEKVREREKYRKYQNFY